MNYQRNEKTKPKFTSWPALANPFNNADPTNQCERAAVGKIPRIL